MTTIHDQTVYSQLIGRIFSGDYPAGSRLVERELAEEIGVSRVPVREALTQMVAQGILVRGEKHRSVRLRQYTAEEVRQLFDFRALLEGAAAQAAAQHASPEQLKQLGQICDQMEAKVGRTRFGEDWPSLDQQFHNCIARAGGNDWVASTIQTLLQQSHFVFFQLRWRIFSELTDAEVEKIMRIVVARHRDVLGHIRDGDGDKARETMIQHVQPSLSMTRGIDHPFRSILHTPRQETRHDKPPAR